MNISDMIRLNELVLSLHSIEEVPDSMKIILETLITRLDMFIQNLVLELRAQPSVFIVDPATNVEDVEGAKEGDIAIFKNRDGVVDVKRFD